MSHVAGPPHVYYINVRVFCGESDAPEGYTCLDDTITCETRARSESLRCKNVIRQGERYARAHAHGCGADQWEVTRLRGNV